jgi:BlaI family transcriptional regulator, penicillinase repressor
MDDKTTKVTDAELAVLQALWQRGPATVRQLSDDVYPGGGATEYGTVHKLLERLEAKGCIRRERHGREYLIHATVERDDLIGRELEALVDKMCGGSLQPLLSHLIHVKGLTAGELRELRGWVEQLSKETKAESKSESKTEGKAGRRRKRGE